jgi:ribokinase
VTPPTAEAVDATGAGDTFAGYLGAELARGVDLRPAIECAVAAASLSVEHPGARGAIPDRAAVGQRRRQPTE